MASKKLYRIKNLTTGQYLRKAHRYRIWHRDRNKIEYSVTSKWDEVGKVFQNKSAAQRCLTIASGMCTKDRKSPAQRVLNMNSEYANVFVVEAILSDGDTIK